MKLISLLLSYSRGTSILAVAAAVFSGIAGAGILALINTLIGRFGEPLDHKLAWAFFGLCALVPIARFLASFMLLRMSQRAILDLRMDLSQRILGAPLRRLEEVGPHRLLTALSNDIGSLAVALTDLPLICMNLAIIVGALSYLGWLSWQVLMLVLVFMAVGVMSYQLPVLAGMKRQKLARQKADALQDHFRGITEGAKELQIHHGRQGAFLRLLRRTSEEARDLNIVGRSIFAAASSWGHMLFFLVVGLLLVVVPQLVVVDTKALTGFVLVLLYLISPIEHVLDTLPMLTSASIAIQNVENLGFSLAEGAPRANEGVLRIDDDGWKEINLREVTHAYYHESENGDFNLGPLDLDIRRGEVIFLTGGNGSGKTTLVKLIAGLYTPEGGQIEVDRQPVERADEPAYRQLFSTVFYDFFLFEELLGLERPELDEEAASLLRDLQLDRKVSVSQGMLSTTKLSQGQRKRLALLTAFLEDRSIYIFDEWAADQDPHFKDVFYHVIVSGLKRRGKTVLVVSHDDRYYEIAERLVKLEDGRIVHDGPPVSSHVTAETGSAEKV